MISYVIQQERGVRPSERPTSGSGAPYHHLNLPSGQTENTARPCVGFLVYS